MKLVGITGTGTGKLGSSVFAVNSGVQIVRQYQPVVSNPSTDAQVAQRAKLKLASQLARDMKKAIAIPKDGLVSSRNNFISANFPAITFASNKAEVDLPNVQLTKSSLSGFPLASASVSGSSLISVSFNAFNPNAYERYQFEFFTRNSDGTLSYAGSYQRTPIQLNEEGGSFTVTPTDVAIGKDMVVYAYGVNLTSDSAKAAYQNLVVNEGRTLASLITSRTISSGDVEVSKTTGVVAAYSE